MWLMHLHREIYNQQIRESALLCPSQQVNVTLATTALNTVMSGVNRTRGGVQKIQDIYVCVMGVLCTFLQLKATGKSPVY